MSDKSGKAKNQRSAKYYSYEFSANLYIDRQNHEIRLLKISTSGIQFASTVELKTEKPISISWKDLDLGHFKPSLLITHEVNKPENEQYKYYYGAQYYDLSDELKDNLVLLLRKLKEVRKQKNQNETEIVPSNELFAIVNEGNDFLKKILSGDLVDVHMDPLVDEIKEYEKAAFFKEDEIAICIQKLTTQAFNFNILGLITPLALEEKPLQLPLFNHILAEVQKIAAVDEQTEEVSKRLMSGLGKKNEKWDTQKKINESSSRLFYAKQKLLQSVMDSYFKVAPESKNLQVVEKIRQEYKRGVEFSDSEVQQSVYTPRSTKPDEDTKPDAIVDLPVSDAKPRYLLWFNITVIVFASVIYLLVTFFDHKEKLNLKEQIGLQINIEAYDLAPPQLELTFGTEEWQKLSPAAKKETYQKIIKYLVTNKLATTSVLLEDNGKLIRVLYERSIID